MLSNVGLKKTCGSIVSQKKSLCFFLQSITGDNVLPSSMK